MDGFVDVVGGGLAGCECALSLAAHGIRVRLFEQRPGGCAPAHRGDGLAELVCSNSLKSMREDSAAGMLKRELDELGSNLLPMARKCSVPAGGALAVNREQFSHAVEEAVLSSPYIQVIREEVTSIPSGRCVICAGPLCSPALAQSIQERLGRDYLAFFDAAAPVVDAESIDMSVAFSQSRYEEGGGDYINCPMSKEEYETFWHELVHAERVVMREFEQKDLFSACQPVEEVARKGVDTLRFGALKPVGILDPTTGHRPWAVVQLRAENKEGTAYNLVGFQTNLTWGEQAKVFRLIPGLESADFVRYGVMHRNTFVDAPRALDDTFAIPGTQVRLAGQLVGTEGYVEAMASGLLAALNTVADIKGLPHIHLPRTTVFGALVAYASDPNTNPYQPMHVNFGLMPPIEGKRLRKRDRYRAYSLRGKEDLKEYVARRTDIFQVVE